MGKKVVTRPSTVIHRGGRDVSAGTQTCVKFDPQIHVGKRNPTAEIIKKWLTLRESRWWYQICTDRSRSKSTCTQRVDGPFFSYSQVVSTLFLFGTVLSLVGENLVKKKFIIPPQGI